MSSVVDRLRGALAERYAVERELGRGGMATVFLARDIRHDRPVAIKVLKPELAAMVGPERFLREIRVAASLNHPHILTLHDSGAADGLLYYVMPVVEGESLSDRMRREGQLPIEASVGIARQIAEALDHAHRQGIIHRDVKPENILMAGDHAFLTDFGVARLAAGSGEARLTETGLAVGTPAYMSPEQIGASSTLDGRSDIYSLGCVLYEMLVGEQPFTGPSAQVILARHAVEPVRNMRLARATLPASLELAVHQAMAKSPADRFATGADFAAALTGAASRPNWGTQPFPQRMVNVPRSLIAASLGVLLVLAAFGAWWRLGRRTGTTLVPDLTVVLPFRVSGTGDAELTEVARLSTDQLALRLIGDGGPRAAYPGTVMAALKTMQADSGDVSGPVARRLAAGLGAGLLVRGQVWRDGSRLMLGATLSGATRDTVLARAEQGLDSPDSLSATLDRLTGELLARQAGARDDELASLLAAPLPALRAYLGGKHAFARGEFAAAGRRFVEAIRLDPNFVQAALGMVATRTFISDSSLERGDSLAQLSRHRLGAADQAYLAALLVEEPAREALRLWEEAVSAAPDRMERWYGLGEVLFHKAPWLGLTDWRERAAAAFRRVLELDPDFVPALGHRLDLAASEGDQAAVRDLGTRYIARDSVGELADYYRWRIAVALGDSGFRRAFRARLDRQSISGIERLVNVAQLDGVALDDAVAAAEVLKRNAGLGNETRWGYTKLHEIALNRGRPAEAADLVRARDEAVSPPPVDRLSKVVEALYWGADTVQVLRLVAERAAAADATPAHESNEAPALYDVCAVHLWRAAHGETDRLPAAIARLRRAVRGTEDSVVSAASLCAGLLELQLLADRKDPGLDARLARFDSLVGSAPILTSWILAASNLTIARLLEERGDLRGALRAVRRRAYITDFRESRVLVALSTFFREEGRLAAKAGERAEAIAAYRHYLALRADAEPSVAPEVAQVRAALAALETGR